MGRRAEPQIKMFRAQMKDDLRWHLDGAVGASLQPLDDQQRRELAADARTPAAAPARLVAGARLIGGDKIAGQEQRGAGDFALLSCADMLARGRHKPYLPALHGAATLPDTQESIACCPAGVNEQMSGKIAAPASSRRVADRIRSCAATPPVRVEIVVTTDAGKGPGTDPSREK